MAIISLFHRSFNSPLFLDFFFSSQKRAFYHRRFLLAETISPDEKKDDDYKKHESDCYSCINPPSQNHQLSSFLIVMICFLGIAFLFLAFLTIRRFRSSFRNHSRTIINSPPSDNDHNLREDHFLDEHQRPVMIDHPIWHIRTIGLLETVINSITIFNYKKGESLMEGSDNCSVCLNEFEENERLRLMPKCRHAFHLACIDVWLRSHKNCPVCRAPVLIVSNGDSDFDMNLVQTGSSGLGSTEVNQVGIEEENGNISALMPVEDDKIGKFRVLSDLGDRRVEVDLQVMQPVRRSVSMDFSTRRL